MRETCTADRPCLRNDVQGLWSHPDAILARDDGDYEVYDCPHCGLRFRVELPQ